MKRSIFFLVLMVVCTGLIACAKQAEGLPIVYEEYVEDTPIPTEEPEATKTITPVKVIKGIGNTSASLLKGGYFVYSKDLLFMADDMYVYSRDRFSGEVKQVAYSSEGDIGYLNVCGDYIYFMTGVDRGNLGSAKDDKNIYRKCLITSDAPELVVSGVTDYGMGYGIKDGVLYCTMKERISPTKYQYSLCKIDLNDLTVISSEENTRFVAIEDRALYQVNSDGEFVCKHWTGEFSLGNLGDAQYALQSLPKHNYTWSFTIEKDNFYYVDLVTNDSPCIMKVSPQGVEVFGDIGEIGADYGTDLYAVDGEVFLGVGTIVSRWGYGGDDYYSHAQYVMANGSDNLYDYSEIEGSKLLYIFDNNCLILYGGSGGIYWLNDHSIYPEMALCEMTTSWGILLESKKSGIESLEMPSGMKFCVK